MNKKVIWVAVLFILSISMLLISTGITGLIILGDNSAPNCETNNDCSNNTTCCLFYHANGGVCAEQDMCADIAVITVQKDVVAEPGMPTSKQATDLALGILLAIGATVLVYGYVTSIPAELKENK